MLILQNISYTHPNRDLLFRHISMNVQEHAKLALIGNNGAGKSTLLKLMAGILCPSAGTVQAGSLPYYVPQHMGQFNAFTVAQALRVEDKLSALQQILDGHATETNLALLNDDWTLEERCQEALAHWKLDGLDLTKKMEALSGGQKTKVFLAGIQIHRPRIVLMDEPSNHLDLTGRTMLYEYVTSTTNTLVVVSHDRTLLNLLHSVYELGKRGVTPYGGNYDFYAAQKQVETNALDQDIRGKEKALRKAKETEKESVERQQKLDARGKKKQEKAGLPTISMNTFKNNAEKSTSRLKGIHAEKVETLSQALGQARRERPDTDKLKINFDHSTLHGGKILVTANDLNFGYDGRTLWKQPLNFTITSGERIAITGTNGSGKTTLLKLLLGKIRPLSGKLHRADMKTVYIDQDYSLIDPTLSVYEQAQSFNYGALQEHELKIRLNRFLFPSGTWDKSCQSLSGGEKMRLLLCCLQIGNQAPDLMVLDEPGNNLDIQNLEILTAAIHGYRGTLIVVSHDAYFLQEVGVERWIEVG